MEHKPEEDSGASHPFTCNTCQVAYRNPDLQKGHMKSDWHRYNLKRRMASLPPLSSDLFTEKVLKARAVSSAEASKATFERACAACQRTYYSENSFFNHLSSQKHRSNELAFPSLRDPSAHPGPVQASSSSSIPSDPLLPLGREDTDHDAASSRDPHQLPPDAAEEFSNVVRGLRDASLGQKRPSPVKRPSNPHPADLSMPSLLAYPQQAVATATAVKHPAASDHATPSQGEAAAVAGWTAKSCLFCNYASPTIALSAHHMERFHGMFIPERQYLVDLEGLISHLGLQVYEDHCCLACGAGKTTTFAVQTHMRDKAHCTIPYKTDADRLEIGDFYDFSATYSDSSAGGLSEVGEENNISRMRQSAPQQGPTSLDQGAPDEDGWETDSSVSSCASDELAALTCDDHMHQYTRLDRHPHHSRSDPRHHHQADGWHSHAHQHAKAVFYDQYELHLPSGKSVGHRALNRYYRQNLPHSPPPPDCSDLDFGPAFAGHANAIKRIRAHNSQVAPRGTFGMAGVSDQVRRAAARSEHRGRSLQQFRAKKMEWITGNVLNNSKGYYYRYERGG